MTPPGNNRVAAAWYASSSFTVNVDVTDGNSHNLELYALDFDDHSRSETVQLSDAITGAVLDTETLSSYSGGDYLIWTISGNVLITFTNTGRTMPCSTGCSSTRLGLRSQQRPPSLSVRTPRPGQLDRRLRLPGLRHHRRPEQRTQLRHHHARRADTLHLVHQLQRWPRSGNRDTPGQQPRRRGLVRLVQLHGRCRCDRRQFPQPGTLRPGLRRSLTERDGPAQRRHHGGGAGYGDPVELLGRRVLDLDHLGQRADHIHQYGPEPMPCSTACSSTRSRSPPPNPGTASFVGTDTSTRGNWIGVYGSQGYDIIGGPSSATYATIKPNGQATYVWSTTSNDGRTGNRDPSGQQPRRRGLVRLQLHGRCRCDRRPVIQPRTLRLGLRQSRTERDDPAQRRRPGAVLDTGALSITRAATT